MPFDDEGTDDERDRRFEDDFEAVVESGTFRPPPHPDDRLWRHPSELSGAVAAGRVAAVVGARDAARESRARRPWALILLAGCAGAAAGSGMLMTFGVNERTVDGAAPDEVAANTPDTEPPTEAPAQDGRGEGGEAQVVTVDLESLEQSLVAVEGEAGSGSGFVISDGGTVLTSASVVGHQVGAEVVVGLADGRRVTGEIGGSDPATDVAVVRLPDGSYPSGLTTREAPPPVGARLTLMARIDGGGYSETETVEGPLTSSTWRLERPDRPALIGLLQIAAGAGPVLEGGPVVDERGDVVGLVTRGGLNWSYATPIDVATVVAEELLENGYARHGWLGIEGRDVSGMTSGAPDEPRTGGVESVGPGSEASGGDQGTTTTEGSATAGVAVSDVVSGGPTDGRLRPGDVIVALDGVPVPDMASLQAALLRYRPGDQVEISYYSTDEATYTTATVTIDGRPED